jgi:hypothetical protein
MEKPLEVIQVAEDGNLTKVRIVFEVAVEFSEEESDLI